MDAWVGGPPSDQERSVLLLLCEGWTNEEIAARLRVSEVTIKKHVSSLLRKFDAANRAELAAKAVRRGYAPGSTPGPPPEGPR